MLHSLDSASDCGSEGRGFESSRGRMIKKSALMLILDAIMIVVSIALLFVFYQKIIVVIFLALIILTRVYFLPATISDAKRDITTNRTRKKK